MLQSFADSKNKLLSIGPFGSKEGNDIWDDGVHSTVRQLVIRADDTAICWIQIEYDDNGKSVWSDKHGADSRPFLGSRTYKVSPQSSPSIKRFYSILKINLCCEICRSK